MIHLVQLCKDSKRNGGCATFLENLAYSLGKDATVYRGMRLGSSESRVRSFGNYCTYLNLSTDDLIDHVKRKGGPLVICIVDGGSDQADELLHVFPDAWFVYHDHRSLQEMLTDLDPKRTVVIRKIHEDNGIGTFIAHPYRRFYGSPSYEQHLLYRSRRLAVCHSRIDSDKRTHWSLEASDLLEAKGLERIQIYGRENRLYGKMTLQKKWPDWQVSKSEFPRGFGSAARLCAGFKFDVDMTRIKDDGGGSQYTSLEAMDAGTIPVLAEDWGYTDFESFSAVDGPDIAEVIHSFSGILVGEKIRRNWDYLARVHSPRRIGQQWKELLGCK